ncbi:MAG: TIGR03617 family F420-dependent LLM class oxidoreductase [Chloroflexi bacterium]|nr:TIGR03617 family F420-dependent LLM class oxidoreductase [Chloroflexota bacterium]
MPAIKLDVTIRLTGDLRHDVEQIKHAERLGFDGVWVSETAHNPFFPLSIAAKETKGIRMATQGAAAFPRSPMITAQIAWDLARQSGGRFSLGLGMLQRAHIERRFSEEWRDPVGRMREYIESLRAIWNSFQTDARLRYRGEHYQFRLMAPFFNPGPIGHPEIPIYITGDDPETCQLAGEVCQGLHAHAMHTAAYLREALIPAVETGLKIADRDRSKFELTAQVFVASGETADERTRAARDLSERLAANVSSPSFRRVMNLHGWGALADELQQMAGERRRKAMQAAITDDVLREFALIAKPKDIYAALVDRYAGIADRVCLEWTSDSARLFEAIAGSCD